MAEGGTFFFDEVAELLPSLQAKLLRIIEARGFDRVGGTKAIERLAQLLLELDGPVHAGSRVICGTGRSVLQWRT